MRGGINQQCSQPDTQRFILVGRHLYSSNQIKYKTSFNSNRRTKQWIEFFVFQFCGCLEVHMEMKWPFRSNGKQNFEIESLRQSSSSSGTMDSSSDGRGLLFIRGSQNLLFWFSFCCGAQAFTRTNEPDHSAYIKFIYAPFHFSNVIRSVRLHRFGSRPIQEENMTAFSIKMELI